MKAADLQWNKHYLPWDFHPEEQETLNVTWMLWCQTRRSKVLWEFDICNEIGDNWEINKAESQFYPLALVLPLKPLVFSRWVERKATANPNSPFHPFVYLVHENGVARDDMPLRKWDTTWLLATSSNIVYSQLLLQQKSQVTSNQNVVAVRNSRATTF